MDDETKFDVKLTKNQAHVMNALKNADAPLSAYTLLDELRAEGFRAPLQVYRALEKLVELGMVHRLESLNAFVACSHPRCSDHKAAAFMICDTCGQVNEISDPKLTDQLQNLAQNSDFSVKKSTIELSGSCQDCADS